jgi:hypothetical protein
VHEECYVLREVLNYATRLDHRSPGSQA